MTAIQCEDCGEIPIVDKCPHGCADKQPKAWRNGRYYYCLTHSTSQVMDYQIVYKGDPALWRERKCDWCKAVLNEVV